MLGNPVKRKLVVLRKLKLALIWTSVASIALSTQAAQLAYEETRANDQRRYRYEFETPDGGTQRLTFALPQTTVKASLNAFQRFNPRDLKRRWRARYRDLLTAEVRELNRRFPQAKVKLKSNNQIIYSVSATKANKALTDHHRKSLREALERLRRQFPHVKFYLQRAEGPVSMRGMRSDAERRAVQAAFEREMNQARRQTRQLKESMERRARAAMDAISRDLDGAIKAATERLDEFKRQYFRERYYRAAAKGVLLPDYARLAEKSRDSITPVTKAWKRQVGSTLSRTSLNTMLGFFQSIPYDTLQSRGTSNGAGFATPPALLARNRGDCDTKSVAMAALAHGLWPNLSIVMVILDDHALLGLSIPAKRGDKKVRFQGETFVLAEPVGPALHPVGSIGEQSRKPIKQVLRLF